MANKLTEIHDRLVAGGKLTYEDGADIFENTMVGTATMQLNKLSREDILKILRTRFPNEEVLTASLRQMFQIGETLFGGNRTRH